MLKYPMLVTHSAENQGTNLQECRAVSMVANVSAVNHDEKEEMFGRNRYEFLKWKKFVVFFIGIRLFYEPPGVVEKMLPPGVSP